MFMLFECQSSHIVLAAQGKINRPAFVLQSHVRSISDNQCKRWLTLNFSLTIGLTQLRKNDLSAAIPHFNP